MRNLIFLVSEAQRNFRNELFYSFEAQRNSTIAEWHFRTKLKYNPTHNSNFTTQCNNRIVCNFDRKRANNLLKKADNCRHYDQNGTKLNSMYKIALLTKKKF